MKPFMRQDSAEYCSSCHKVHLDVPVNNYRWIRGFNDYDNWQASGVSGQGARSFYYPPKTSTCAQCHMPADEVEGSWQSGTGRSILTVSRQRTQRWPREQGRETDARKPRSFPEIRFHLRGYFCRFADRGDSGQTEMRRRSEGPQLASTFAVGEEAEQSGQILLRDVGKLAAPLDAAGAKFQPGSSVRVDVVVRTRKIGHFFPGGTVDSFDIWLELKVQTRPARLVFWSGRVEDGGKGPVETGAHFYRSYQLDAEGNPINKRNACQTRSVLYVRLIPPGAADVAHYRVKIPKDVRGPMTLHAKLNYRKFSHYYTKFSLCGRAEAGTSRRS